MKLGLAVNLTIFIAILIMVGLLTEQRPDCYVIPAESVEEVRQNATHNMTEEHVDYVSATIDERKEFWFFSSGESMLPVIRDGTACRCTKTDDYLVGDIVNFPVNYDGELIFVTHRIIGYELDNTYITKGDNNPVPDPWKVPQESILCEIEQKTMIQKAVEKTFF